MIIEINCEVDKIPTLPLATSPRKNSTKKRPALYNSRYNAPTVPFASLRFA